MYIAMKDVSIKDWAFKPGDVVPRAAQEALPPHRLVQMVEHNFLKLLSDEAVIEQRLNAIEARLDALETRRGPGRPRKEEADGNG